MAKYKTQSRWMEGAQKEVNRGLSLKATKIESGVSKKSEPVKAESGFDGIGRLGVYFEHTNKPSYNRGRRWV